LAWVVKAGVVDAYIDLAAFRHTAGRPGIGDIGRAGWSATLVAGKS
jgi:hypothetical protein